MRLIKTIRFALALAAFFSLNSFALAGVNIFIQPQSKTVAAGSNVVFSATVSTTAGETITAYTWLTAPTSSGPFTTVAGATTTTLTLPNAQPTNSGVYFIRVTYQAGTNPPSIAASTLVTLTVQDQARIVTQPTNLISAAGSSATFTVVGAGEGPLGYQWKFNGANLSNDARISGADSASLTISDLLTSDTGNYSVVVSNSFSSTNSQIATLTVLFPPTFTEQPTNTTELIESTITLSATVTGSTPLSYRWRKDDVNLTDNARISGATSDTLVITEAVTNDSGIYSLFVSNALGSTTSVGATLTVLAPPIFTSPTNVSGKQGVPFEFTLTASGSVPMTFGAEGLPDGLTLSPTNGLISGTPLVSGLFEVAVSVSNPALTVTGIVVIDLITSIPTITSPLATESQQGKPFSYTIVASDDPVSFSANGLPGGLSIDAATGLISGVPIERGEIFVTINAANQWGTGSDILALNLATAAPVITSSLVANGIENEEGFNYTITASNGPVSFGATGLPLGLKVNPTTGDITGTPVYGGTTNVVISAKNAWGTGTALLEIEVAYLQITNLVITDVTYSYSAPYLLDFTFTLRETPDGRAIVRPEDEVQVIAFENQVQIGNETAFFASRGLSANTKQLKTFVVMDYTYSMLLAPNAIPAMQEAVKDLINQEPGTAQFAINEFHADDVVPNLVSDFTSDKVLLAQLIDGIEATYVQGNYSGSRLYDALDAAISQFGAANTDEQRYLIVMSDGDDESSVLAPDTGMTITQTIVSRAKDANVQLYCVGFGPDVNTNVMQLLASGTGGRYFAAADATDIGLQFTELLKDLNSQYYVRWATLQRGASFQPSFEVSVEAQSNVYNYEFPFEIEDDSVNPQTEPPTMKLVKIDNNSIPVTTNDLSFFAPDFDPATYAGSVQAGELRLVPDSTTNVSSIMLRAFYTPRFVRSLRLQYRANFPCTPIMMSAGSGELLAGWSLTETNDDQGGHWLTLSSPNPTNLLSSLPYGVPGDLIKFQFQHQAVPSPQLAFSLIEVDNSIYAVNFPTGQSFALDTNAFVTVFDAAPPFGTPIPWLISHGFTSDFADAELSDPNGIGLPIWKQYLAGLNPSDPTSTFNIRQSVLSEPGEPNRIVFGTVAGKTYRVDTATSLDNWYVLLDGIAGTGGDVSVEDGRDLSTVREVFYRIAVY